MTEPCPFLCRYTLFERIMDLDICGCLHDWSWLKLTGPGRAIYRKPRGGKFRVWKKEGGAEADIVLCEAQGGCYTLHLLCWHASTLAVTLMKL